MKASSSCLCREAGRKRDQESRRGGEPVVRTAEPVAGCKGDRTGLRLGPDGGQISLSAWRNPAARLGRSLEPYHLTWMEDPVPAELQEGFRLIRQHTITPIAVGEVFNTIWDCKRLMDEQLIDYIRTTVVHAGGISHLRRIFDYASHHHVRSGSHGATDLSPVCMAAALHLDVSIPNFGLQEYMRHTEATDAVFPHDYHYADGYLHPSERPGLGVDIDEELAAEYPYRPAQLPVNRLEDGTVHSW